MIPAIIAGGVGLLQAGIGAAQKIKAGKMARNLKRPVLEDNEYIDDMYTYTASQASQGLDDAARQAFITNNDRNVSAGINAVLRGGGNVNNIGDIIDAGGSAVRQMALADQELRMRNQRNFLAAVQAKADEDRDQFMINEMVPFRDQSEAIAKLNQQGGQNIWGGVTTLAKAGMNAFMPNPNEDGSSNASGGWQNAQVVSSTLNPGQSAPATAPAGYLPSSTEMTTAGILNRYFNRPI